MPRRKQPEPPLPPKELTLFEIDRGIQKLQKRVSEIKAILDERVDFKDGRVDSLESEIAATIEDVFGTGSRENKEHSYFSLGPSVIQRVGFRQNPAYAHNKNQATFLEGLPRKIEILEGLIRRLEEKKEDFKKCPRCNQTWRLQNFCSNDGSPLVDLSYDPDAPTLTPDAASQKAES
ncbi:MAG TPA: hypothetical protein VF791_15030 [Pyrinomonadaceae bacterium]